MLHRHLRILPRLQLIWQKIRNLKNCIQIGKYCTNPIIICENLHLFQTLSRGNTSPRRENRTSFNLMKRCLAEANPCLARYAICFQSAVFLPTPLKGATFPHHHPSIPQSNFNPRSPKGATSCHHTSRTYSGISIHAPRRERPLCLYSGRNAIYYFNPRSPKGATDREQVSLGPGRYFNPRSPKGATVRAPDQKTDRIDFNPRSPKGATKTYCQCRCRKMYFNPRSPKGATDREQVSLGPGRYFNPRSPKGATWSRELFGRYDTISIHAPRRERRVNDRGIPRGGSYFNPRSPKGATLQHSRIKVLENISIHAPRRERHPCEYITH